MKYLLKIWKLALPFVFIVVCIHFLKDVTQDILKIPTFLDLLGNVNEDLSGLPPLIQHLIVSLGFISFVVELFLIVAIPKIIKNKKTSKLKKYVIASLFFLALYFISVIDRYPLNYDKCLRY